MTLEEQIEVQKAILGPARIPVCVDGIYLMVFFGTLAFRHGNTNGLLFIQQNDDGTNRIQLACRYNDECRFNPTCEPTLEAIVSAIKKSWLDFIKGTPCEWLEKA